MNDPKIVAMFGGPGIGKSTTAAAVFAGLKQRGHNVELVHEVAKDLTWEGRSMALSHQPYVAAKQMFHYDRLYGQVDVIVTDTSTLLAGVYAPDAPSEFLDWISADWRARNTLNVVLRRDARWPYSTHGRPQSQSEAELIDRRVMAAITRARVTYTPVTVDRVGLTHVDEIIYDVEALCPRP